MLIRGAGPDVLTMERKIRISTTQSTQLIICWIQILASSCGAFISGRSSLDDLAIYQLAKASSLSYIDMKRMSSSAYLKSSGLEPIAQVVDARSQSGATLFRMYDDGHPTTSDGKQKQRHRLIIACRGSATVRNFGTNLQFKLVPAMHLSQDNVPENSLVHEGFQMASAGLWKEICQPLKDYLDSTVYSTTIPMTEIIYTGHSLGAATALLCATHHQATFKDAVRGGTPASSIITFGGPRLCNSELSRYLRNEALCGCTILHVVHTKDPVLTNNQQLWNTLGFENVGIELECDPYHPHVLTTEKQDDASLTTNNRWSTVAWNIVDHCYYMGVYMGPRLFL